eukprot:gene3526-1732_t
MFYALLAGHVWQEPFARPQGDDPITGVARVYTPQGRGGEQRCAGRI